MASKLIGKSYLILVAVITLATHCQCESAFQAGSKRRRALTLPSFPIPCVASTTPRNSRTYLLSITDFAVIIAQSTKHTPSTASHQQNCELPH
jgi:hypothetical protein